MVPGRDPAIVQWPGLSWTTSVTGYMPGVLLFAGMWVRAWRKKSFLRPMKTWLPWEGLWGGWSRWCSERGCRWRLLTCLLEFYTPLSCDCLFLLFCETIVSPACNKSDAFIIFFNSHNVPFHGPVLWRFFLPTLPSSFYFSHIPVLKSSTVDVCNVFRVFLNLTLFSNVC